MGASSYQALAAYLALFDLDFEATGPPELVNQIRRLAARLRKSVGRAR